MRGTGGGSYHGTKADACDEHKIHVEVFDIVDSYMSEYVKDAWKNAAESSSSSPIPSKRQVVIDVNLSDQFV